MTDGAAGETDYMAEIAALSTLVDKGRGLVDANNSIDLSSLEAEIADLCRRMAAAPPKNAEQVTAAIHELVGHLGELAEALKAQHDLGKA